MKFRHGLPRDPIKRGNAPKYTRKPFGESIFGE